MSKMPRTTHRKAATNSWRGQAAGAPGQGSPAPRRALLFGALAIAGASGAGALALGFAGKLGDGDSSAVQGVPLNLDADTVSFEREEVDLGRVALEKVVPVSARLTNHSRRKVILSQATAQTLEGC